MVVAGRGSRVVPGLVSNVCVRALSCIRRTRTHSSTSYSGKQVGARDEQRKHGASFDTPSIPAWTWLRSPCFLAGRAGVGKSSIRSAFGGGTFNPRHDMTIGVEFDSKIIDVGGVPIRVSIYDTVRPRAGRHPLGRRRRCALVVPRARHRCASRREMPCCSRLARRCACSVERRWQQRCWGC